ncbi:MAG: hypothetical protein HZB12_00515 [Candidatus Yonathbacteria bacterium]|nr:hypothetical protein [Candidatus Yonathbacteria bacterium]
MQVRCCIGHARSLGSVPMIGDMTGVDNYHENPEILSVDGRDIIAHGHFGDQKQAYGALVLSGTTLGIEH